MGQLVPSVKPDLDNISKIILDALNKVAFNDDKQVAQLSITKRYGEQPFVKVYLEEYNPCTLKI